MNLEEEAKKHYPKSKEYCDAYRAYIVALLHSPWVQRQTYNEIDLAATTLADKEWELRGQ